MPIALFPFPISLMILRPDPPSSPWTGSICSTGKWKCCSNSFLRMSMQLLADSSQRYHRREAAIGIGSLIPAPKFEGWKEKGAARKSAASDRLGSGHTDYKIRFTQSY